MRFLTQLDQGLLPETRTRLALAVLLAAWLFGGATRFDVLAPIIPLLFGLVVIAVVFAARSLPRLTLLEKVCWIGVFAVPLFQLVPLPPALWTRLPTHDYPEFVLATVGQSAWLPLSLTPSRTISSAFAFVPALAVYLCARDLAAREANRLLLWLVGFASVSSLLGLVQLSGGSGSRLRFYSITNKDAAVGFFSNANHFGTFIALCIPIATYLGLRFDATRTVHESRAPLIVAASAVALLTAAGLASMSRAAYGATAFALLLSAALVLLHLPLSPRAKLGGAVGSVTVVAAAAAAFVASGRFAEMAEIDQVGTRGRLALWPRFAEMARDAFPFGSGLGSFDPVYRAYEDYARLSARYLNNAHNDLAQVAIEAGFLGLAMLVLWAWLIVRTFARALANPGLLERESSLGRAKLVVLGFGIIVLLGHSLVDYPLRGACVSATFALLLAQALGAAPSLQRSVRSHR